MVLMLLPATVVAQVNPNSLISGAEYDPDTIQNKEPEGIVYDSGEEPDSLLPSYVFRFTPSFRSVKIFNLSHPSLNPTGVELHNPVHRFDGNHYIDLGALGQVQQSLYPFADQTFQLHAFGNAGSPLQLTLQPDPSPVYRQVLHAQPFFHTLRPFTHLQYGSSIDKDYQISVIHTQNIKPRWNVAFLYDLVSRDGSYTNSEVTNHILDVTSNYYSVDARYQIQAQISFNRLRQQENGGVQDRNTCWDFNRTSGVPVNMYSAQNQWRDFKVRIHQSFNTVRQYEHLRPIRKTLTDTIARDTSVARAATPDSSKGSVIVRGFTIHQHDTVIGFDTIRPHQPHSFNTGVFALDLNYGKHRRIFTDPQANSWFYNWGSIDSTLFLDSTTLHQLSAEIYWTNDAYMSHRWSNPFVILVGLRPEYNRLQFAVNSRDNFSTSLFARTRLSLGRFTLYAQAEEVTGSYRNGDYRIDGSLHLLVGRHSHFSAALLSEAQAPALFYYHNEGCYSWEYDDDQFNKIKRQQLSVGYAMEQPDSTNTHLRILRTRTSATLLSDNIWISDQMRPTQGNETGLLLQATVETHLRFGWFNIRMQQMLQHCTKSSVLSVPLLASKNSLYADLHIFHRALRMQTGIDLRYHTPYWADEWNPILGAFYRQSDIEVGNYLVADFWLTLQIKRASIYAKVSHFNAPLEKKPSYFSLPYYPLEGLGVYWGVIWKFFN